MMGKFGFSKGGRKKPPAQLALNEPMSKAHRILGSTPLNIDSPKAWDDGSSSFSAATVSTIPSYTGTEDDFSDHEVAIARSEGDWVDESGLLPTVMESTSLDQVDDFGRTDPVRLLRKSQSSSTITPWYDESKTLSRPKQRVSLAPSTGSRHLSLKDDMTNGASQGKKKPPKLDLTPNRRLSRKSSIPQLHTDGAIVGAPDSSIKSPSIFSLLTPIGDRHPETRKIQRRLTKENPHSPIAEPARPKTSDTTSSRVGTSSSREVPSLYDHYEQMMDRQFALDEASLEEEDESLESRDIVSRDSEVSLSTQSTSHGSSSPQDTRGADASPRRASTRTSKQVQPVNLQQSSMLMLSDSDSDGEDTPQQRSFSRQSVSAFPSSARSSVQPSASVRASHSSRPSRTAFDIKGTRSNRSSKRTSFAPANTYIPHSNSGRNSEDGDTSTNQDPRASMAFGANSAAASCRASLMSNYSARSTGEYVHEAKAVRLLPARRPSKLSLDDDGNTGSHTSQSHSNGTQGNSDVSSDDEIASSPLSQTSMEFFLRSAHSSIDGAGARGRMMTVSREEEMLLESLRHKAKEAQKKNTVEPGSPKRRPSLTSSAKSITSDADSLLDQASTFEFDFPAPPSAKRDSLGISTRRSLSVRVRANGSVDKSQFATIAEEEVLSNEPRPASSTSSPQRQQPVRGILKKTTHSLPPSQQSIQDYMNEDGEDSEIDDFSEFDYLAPQTFEPQTFVSQSPATPSFSPKSPDDMEFLPSTRFGDPVAGGNKFRSTRGSLQATAISSENSANSLDSAIGENADEAGVPRPDSPISPDAFPAVPQVRTRLNSIARLSAVGLPQI